MTDCLKDHRITWAGGGLRRSLVQASACPQLAVSCCSGLSPSCLSHSACWALSVRYCTVLGLWCWAEDPERRMQVTSLLTQVNTSGKTQHHWNMLFPSPSPHTLELWSRRAIGAMCTQSYLFLSFSRFHLSSLLILLCTVLMIHIYVTGTSGLKVWHLSG